MAATPIDETELFVRAQAVVAAAHPGSELGALKPLTGGTSSITYRADLTVGGQIEPVVLKVAPAGLMPTKNRDVLRQAKVQRALTGTGVPVPRVIAEHQGAPPEIPPFFVMSFEDGDCVEPNSLPAEQKLPASEVRLRELEAARIMGVLHSLDPAALGYGDEPVVTPAEELDRWVQSYAACDEDLRIGGEEEVRQMLIDSTPSPSDTTIIHGDFRLGNTLSKGDRVISVIDWEIWARSDPRVDLGWFLMMGNPDAALGRTIAEGMPSNEELVEVYENARGAKVTDFEWFAALVRYKQAAVTALLIRNARKRGVDNGMVPGVALLDSARQLLKASGR
ncbi:MAG: phosphotransferase family protein [Acidimicrobiia bacterium]